MRIQYFHGLPHCLYRREEGGSTRPTAVTGHGDNIAVDLCFIMYI